VPRGPITTVSPRRSTPKRIERDRVDTVDAAEVNDLA